MPNFCRDATSRILSLCSGDGKRFEDWGQNRGTQVNFLEQ
ncbi:hypothetical protein NIES2104_29540 [Leptolyngbya sp. NIES-2104]|nr:hypothetical protein NIES2104_29540 [Leptolyngbya sp. NIES-2104]